MGRAATCLGLRSRRRAAAVLGAAALLLWGFLASSSALYAHASAMPLASTSCDEAREQYVSIVMASYRRSRFLVDTIPRYAAHPLVSEVVVADDAESGDADVLRAWLPRAPMTAEQRRKVRVVPSSVRLGAMRNKVRAVQLARLPWVALLDSDNDASGDRYFAPLLAQWARSYGRGGPPSPGVADTIVFCPEVLDLGGRVFNYTTVRTDVGDVNRSTWNTTRSHAKGVSFLNTGNYVLHGPSVLRVWESLAARGIEAHAVDVLVMNHALVSAGFSLVTVPGSRYLHVVHDANLWTLTVGASTAFLKAFNWTLNDAPASR